MSRLFKLKLRSYEIYSYDDAAFLCTRMQCFGLRLSNTFTDELWMKQLRVQSLLQAIDSRWLYVLMLLGAGFVHAVASSVNHP